MARQLSRFLRGATNWGSAAAPFGPKAAGAAAIAGGAYEALQGEPSFDRAPYDKAFRSYMTGVNRDTRRVSRELAARRGARQASSGINDSALGQFLHTAGDARVYSASQRHINDARANLESQIAHAEQMMEQGNSAMERNRWAQTRNMLLQKLDSAANPETDNKPTAESVTEMMKSWGFDDETIQQYLQGAGLTEQPVMATPAGTEPAAAAPAITGEPLQPRLAPKGAMGTQDPFEHGQFPMMKGKAMTKKPSVVAEQAKEELGDFIVDFLTEHLGEEFADIFEW